MEQSPVHPGQIVKQKIEDMGWESADLAFVLGASASEVSKITNCHKSISPAMAKKLALAFGDTAEFWLGAQSAYDLSRSQKPSPMVMLRGRIFDHFPLREMINRGWIKDADTPEELERNFSRHFECEGLDQVLSKLDDVRAESCRPLI